jgi:hypothetical protein
VSEERAAPSPAAEEFGVLRTAPELEAERRGLDRWLAAPPDKVLALVAQMDDPAAMPAGAGSLGRGSPLAGWPDGRETGPWPDPSNR